MFAGRVVPPLLLGVATTVVMLALGTLVADVRIPAAQLPALLLTLLVTAASCSAFGLILGAVALRTRDALVLANLVLYVMLLVCGVNIPSSTLPSGLAAFGRAMPLTHGIEAARRIIDDAGGALGLVGIEALKAVGYMAVAVVVLHVLERQSRKHAVLDQM